jgi:hypothetical protein
VVEAIQERLTTALRVAEDTQATGGELGECSNRLPYAGPWRSLAMSGW